MPPSIVYCPGDPLLSARVLGAVFTVNNQLLCLFSIYAPVIPAEQPTFYVSLTEYLCSLSLGDTPLIWMAILIMFLDPSLDSSRPSTRPDRGPGPLRLLMSQLGLVDSFRQLHSDGKRFTNHSGSHVAARRLDRLYVSASLLNTLRRFVHRARSSVPGHRTPRLRSVSNGGRLRSSAHPIEAQPNDALCPLGPALHSGSAPDLCRGFFGHVTSTRALGHRQSVAPAPPHTHFSLHVALPEADTRSPCAIGGSAGGPLSWMTGVLDKNVAPGANTRQEIWGRQMYSGFLRKTIKGTSLYI
jgi:hypothetical protein